MGTPLLVGAFAFLISGLVAPAGASAAPKKPAAETAARPGIRWRPLYEPGGGGAITSVRVSPHDPRHVISAGDMLGVATSFDGGDSWRSTFGFLSYEFSGGITFHPTDPKVVWIGSATGPYKSVDRGIHWVSKRGGMPQVNAGKYTAIVETVLFDPGTPDRLLTFGGTSRRWNEADTLGWVWESTDGGENWRHLATIPRGGGAASTDDKVKGANVVWAAYASGPKRTLHLLADGAGWFASEDGGRTWRKREYTGLPTAPLSITLHPKNPAVVWATTGSYLAGAGDATREPGGVYKSVDGGKTFAPSDRGITKVNAKNNNWSLASHFNNVVVSPADPDVLYTNDGAWNAAVLYKSTNGGATWKPVASREGIGVARETAGDRVFPPQTATFAGISVTGTADPRSAERAYFYNTEFILRTRDGGRTWDDATAYRPDPTRKDRWRGRGWVGWCATNFAWSPYDRNVAIAQAMDAGRGWVSDDGLKTWGYVSSKETHPWLGGQDVTFTRDGHVFISTGQFGEQNGIHRSTDGGRTWTTLAGARRGLPETGWGNKPEYGGIYAHPEKSNLVWVMLGGNILHSDDAGESWHPVREGMDARYIAGDPTKPGRFYVSARDGVYVTEDGRTFTNIGGPRPASRGRINCDALGRVYACQWREGRTGVWRHTPGTKTWERLLDEPLAFEVNADPSDPARLLLVTNMDPFNDLAGGNGVWVSADGGRSWSRQDDGLAMRRGMAVAFNPHDPEQVVVGTFGRGFFTARWARTFKPSGERRYASTAEDVAHARPAAAAAAQPAPAPVAGPGEMTRVIRDFGPGGLDYTYGETWKNGATVKPEGDALRIDATEHGGGGIVLNGVRLAPNGQTHLALRARLLAGNKAGRLAVNLNRGASGQKVVTFDLGRLSEREFVTLTEPLGDAPAIFDAVQQIQIQGANFGPGAQPLKILIDKIGTTSADAGANAAARQAAANDPTGGPPPGDKPSAPGWGFYPDFPQAWMSTHDRFVQRTKQGSVNVVFLGDSITQGWGGDGIAVWDKRYAPLNAVNYGIGGDSTRQVLWRLRNGAVDGIRPKLVVLNIGTNNLYNDHNAGTDAEIAEGITAVVKTLRQKLPATKILLLGILPRQNEYFSGRIRNINAIIARLDDGKTVRFLDMGVRFQATPGKGDVVKELYTPDQLHLAKMGYEVWADAMQPVFEQMLRLVADVSGRRDFVPCPTAGSLRQPLFWGS